MKRFFLKALYLGVVLGIAGLAGCQNPFDPIREPAAQGKGRVVVTIGDPGTARTIAPAETLFTSYTLTFSGPAQVDPIEVSGVSVKKELELEVGDWTITATGYTGTEGAAVAEGSAAITVSSGETSPVNILLGPKTGGAPGTFSYSLKIPDGLGNGAQLIISRSTGVDLQTISLVYNASGISGSVNLDPGEYLVRVRLQKGGLYAGLTEVLHIYSGLTSTLPLKEYTDNDFRAAVDKGFDLTSLVTKPVSWVKPVTTLADQTQYTGTVAWQNNAGVAFAGATFGENTVYQAVVTLEAKTGYTFTGIAANSFTYTGATVVNVEDSGIVTITFPATAAAPSEPKSNAQHLAMLRNLGVAVDNPDLPIAPNKQPYDPQTSSSTARAATSGSGPSLGPLGKIYSQPQREIFAAGYHEINVSGSVGAKDHVLFEDFKNKTDLTVLGQNSDSDSSWAEATDHLKLLRKSVAADLDGDGIDEVVIVTLVRATDKMLINKGVYNGSNFTVTQVREESLPNTVDAMVPTGDTWDMSHIGWTLITTDLNGDGKQECILTLPSGASGVAYMYLLDNNLAISPIDITPYQVGFPSGHGRYPMVTAADYDQDGKDELCLMIGTNDGSFNAPYYILDDKDAGFAKLHEGYVGNGNTRLRIGNLVAGDFTHDGLPDTAFYGHTSNTDNMDLLLLKTSLNSNFNPVFDWVVSANQTLGSGNGAHLIPRIAAGDVDGDRQTDLYAANRLWTFNGSSFEQVTGTGALFDPADYFDRYDTVIGDVTGDGKDDVVMFYGWAKIQIYYYDGGYKRFVKQLNSTVTSHNETGCLPNVDNDSFILQDTGDRELLFSNPQVIAVLASPPYYAGINDDGDGGTSFGYSKGSGSSDTHSGGFSVGVSVGFEFTAPFNIGKAEFEASMKNSFSWAQSTSKEINETWGWNTPVGEDLVIFTAIPFDVYYYKVLKAPEGGGADAAKANDVMTINVPRKARTYHHELSYYNSVVPEAYRVTVNHTLGDPSSYYNRADRATLKGQAGGDGLFSLTTEITAGAGRGSSTIGIEQLTGTDKTFAFDTEVEVKASATFAGAKVGVSTGFSYGYETTTSVSNGTFIEGTVPAIPTGDYTINKDFDWGLMAFPRWEGNQKSYVFVTYWTELHH